MSHTKRVEKIKTCVLRPIIPPPENIAIYEIMRKNMVQPDRPQMAIRRNQFACCIPKATDRHSEYEIPIAFPQHQ